MKRFYLITAAALLLLLAACSSAFSPAAGKLTEKDVALCYNGQTFAINSKADAVISALGGGYSYEESDSCAYEGLDKLYEYDLDGKTAVVFTVPLLDGEDAVCQIETDSPLFSTPKGITVGSTLEEVTAAYGSDYTVDGSNYYFFAGEPSFTDTPHIYFTIENGSVAFLSIYSARNHG